MKKVYIVKVAKIDEDRWIKGYQIVGCVDSMEKVEKKIADFREKEEVDQYWEEYKTDENKKIKFYIEELEVE